MRRLRVLVVAFEGCRSRLRCPEPEESGWLGLAEWQYPYMGPFGGYNELQTESKAPPMKSGRQRCSRRRCCPGPMGVGSAMVTLDPGDWAWSTGPACTGRQALGKLSEACSTV